MNWLMGYQFRHYLRNALWVQPVLGMVVALVAIRVLHALEEQQGWRFPIDAETARAALGTLASSMFTFAVFVCSTLLVAVQLASGQLTPRIIALVFNERSTRLALTLFVFSFTFALGTLGRVRSNVVPWLITEVSIYSCVLSLAVFLFLIDHVGKFLRPSGAIRRVARLARQVIDSVYPHSFGPDDASPPASHRPPTPALVVASRSDGVVMAFDLHGLVALARRLGCTIELVPQVGDDVSPGEPLFRVYGLKGPAPERLLLQSVAIGQERTLEQDPAYAFRILVDIGSKALSPGINDPTTAVVVIDQIHHLLRIVGRRKLEDGTIRDADSRTLLIYRTPSWPEFVRLAITEIRQFGGRSIQVVRRLRAMLENLIVDLPEARAAALRTELHLLHRSVERDFTDPEDRVLAGECDLQGVGGVTAPLPSPPS